MKVTPELIAEIRGKAEKALLPSREFHREILVERLANTLTPSTTLALCDEIEALKAENAKLREALKPFARLYADRYKEMGDDQPVYGIVVTTGDLSRARAALEE